MLRNKLAPSEPDAKPKDQGAQKDEDKKEKRDRGAIVVAPLPIVNPAIGAGNYSCVRYIFPLQEKRRTDYG